MSKPKLKTITLECLWEDQPNSDYRVRSITDSVEYRPGNFLTKKTVAELCAARDWKVVVVKRAD
jgi:hypothetical protein